MNPSPDVIARSESQPHRDERRGNPSDGRDYFASLATATPWVRMLARESLPILLVLYPLLLLLDDLEPGFVRSVVNPHAFLLALIVAGMLASDTPSIHRLRRAVVSVAVGAAIIGGVWIWWKLQAGMLGIVIGFLTAFAIALCVFSFVGEPDSSDRTSSGTS